MTPQKAAVASTATTSQHSFKNTKTKSNIPHAEHQELKEPITMKRLREENQQLKEAIHKLQLQLFSSQQSPPAASSSSFTKHNRHPSDLQEQTEENPRDETTTTKSSKKFPSADHAGLKHRKSPSRNNNASVSSTKLRPAVTIPPLFHDDEEANRPVLVADDSYDNDDEEQAFLITPEASSAVGFHKHTNRTNHDDDPPSFWESAKDRGMWLVGLLLLQSLSSFIIRRNEVLLQDHIIIVQFLTMLVGAGGNGGNQASVKVIRGLATGKIQMNRATILEELRMGVSLALLVGCAGALRAMIFSVPFMETLAITTSLVIIVFLSVVLGTLLPIGMKCAGLDPAHSSTTIQVLMDILGVTITVHVSGILLDSAFGRWIVSTLSGDL